MLLHKKSVFFTGKILVTKASAEARVAALGAIVHKAASKTTQFMVAGKNAPSAQVAAAKRNGTVVWSEDEFNQAAEKDEQLKAEAKARREGQGDTGSSRLGEFRRPGT